MKFFIEGLLLQASIILALGAQNIFLLESSLKKQRPLLVATICSICDVLLIALGVMGAASLFVQIPMLKFGFGILGVLFLAYYGIKKVWEGFRPQHSLVLKNQTPSSIKQMILLSLAFSLLNPHVYLDAIILIGGYSAKFPELSSRVQFGAGAGTFSAIWFFGLALFASAMSSLLNNPKVMRTISMVSGFILIGLACKLGCDVIAWGY